MSTKNIHEFPELMQRIGINPGELGAVMLPVESFDIFGEGRDTKLDTSDLYVSENPKFWWVNGDVSDKAHITLLYGLLTPAYEQKENVDEVLADWDRPEYFAPQRVTFFPSPTDEKYAAIVVEIDQEDPFLLDAHARLSYLPHVDTYAIYKPHFTLAYVRLEAAQHWMDVINDAQFHIYVKEGLDYGENR